MRASETRETCAEPVFETARLVDASVAYGEVRALEQVSLRLGPGEICVLLGPNGSGKSTIARLLAGLLRPDAGSVDWGRHLDRPRGVGLVPQDIALYPFMTARENCLAFGSVAGIDRRHIASGADRALALTGCSHIGGTRVGRLSGGYKRRVNIAVALCARPRLLILDEPTAGVDREARHAIGATLRALRDDGTSILLITHDFEDADTLADRVVVLMAGRIVAQGEPARLLADIFPHRRRLDVSFAKDPDEAQRRLLHDLGASPRVASHPAGESVARRSWVILRETDDGNGADLITAFTRGGLAVAELRFSTPGLETLYMRLCQDMQAHQDMPAHQDVPSLQDMPSLQDLPHGESLRQGSGGS